MNVTDNLDDLLYLIHQSLKKVLYAENCFVALYEPASGMFHFPFFVDQFDEAPPPQQVGQKLHGIRLSHRPRDADSPAGLRSAGRARRSGARRHAFALLAGRAACALLPPLSASW